MLPSGPVSDDTDTLFQDPLRAPGPFRFDDDVVRVFPDMIKRSVPGYETVIAMTGLLAGRFATAGTRVYDLGCSLGAGTLAMHRHIRTPGTRIVAVDNSRAMMRTLRGVLAARKSGGCAIEMLEADLADIAFEAMSMAVLNYTLQFVPVPGRQALLERISAAMEPGSILVLSEKVRFPDERLNALNVEMHHDFKRANGYSELEIAAKRDSLETVLIPETLNTHRERLLQAGFKSCDVWFQCFNFASLVALR